MNEWTDEGIPTFTSLFGISICESLQAGSKWASHSGYPTPEFPSLTKSVFTHFPNTPSSSKKKNFFLVCHWHDSPQCLSLSPTATGEWICFKICYLSLCDFSILHLVPQVFSPTLASYFFLMILYIFRVGEREEEKH